MPRARACFNSQRRRILTGAAALFFCAATVIVAAAEPVNVTLAFLEERVKADPDDVTALNRLSAICLGRFRASGRYAELERAAQTAAQSLKATPAAQNAGGLMARAKVEAEYHRFGVARDEARRLVNLAPKPAAAFLLLGDALLELGQPDEALEAWQEAARHEELPIELPMRLARRHWLRGELDAARAEYGKALDAIGDAAQPQARVWAYVQRGQMAFGQGDWPAAEKDYLAAAGIAPDGFSVLDHLGELRAAQGRYPEAVAAYEQIVKSTGDRPEFMQSLGDVLLAAGDPAAARPWHDRALAGYLASVASGNGHYFHHLAGFYCDVAPNPAEAVRWARRDLELRGSVFANDALGWALYANGEWAAAAVAAGKAVALNTPDAHLIYHAGMIFSRAGNLKRGGELLRRVGEVNPRYLGSFHVHR